MLFPRVLLGLVLLASASGLAFAAETTAAPEPLTLRPEVQLSRAVITLGDVFSGLPAEKDKDVATAPAPGKSVTYDVRVLARLARDHGLAWQPQSNIDKCVLTRAATPLSMEKVAQLVQEKIIATGATWPENGTIALDNRAMTILLPAESDQAFSVENFTYDEKAQRFRADLVIPAAAGVDTIRKPLGGRLIVQTRVPVLAKQLAAGTVLGERDILWIEVQRERLGNDILTDAGSLIGQELRHDMPEGQYFRLRDVAAPRLVLRGSLVTLKVETPLMLITTQGRALQDGAKGDTVRVTNTQSNRVVEGIVEASGAVRIPALQRLAQFDQKDQKKD